MAIDPILLEVLRNRLDAIADEMELTLLKSAAIYGGVGMNPQIQKLRNGAEIVVACPGRLLDHLQQGTIRLADLEVLVLDEADRMFDMGFLPDIRKILRYVPAKRQTLLFSATMPDDIRQLAQDVLHAPVTVEVNPSSPARTVAHASCPSSRARSGDWPNRSPTTAGLSYPHSTLRRSQARCSKCSPAGNRLRPPGAVPTSRRGPRRGSSSSGSRIVAPTRQR